MIRHTVYKFNFNEPENISLEKYNYLKFQLHSNSNFQLHDNSDSFWNRFKWIIIISIILAPIALGFILLLLSAQDMINYNKYLNERKEYYNRLKYSIMRSKDYQHFIEIF